MLTSMRRWIELILLVVALAACSGAPPKPAGESPAEAQPAADPALLAAYRTALTDLQAERYPQAEQALRQLTQQHPRHRGPWLNLAIALGRQDKAEEAETLLKQTVGRFPDFAEAHHELAVLLRVAGRFAEARQSYDAAIAARPDFALAYRNLGLLCDLYLHDTSCALSNYQKFQQLTPANDEEVEQWIADLQRRVTAQN